MQLYELIYVSTDTREMSQLDLTELLEQSMKKNLRLNVTELLIYHRREFMQLHEGDRKTIFDLYETICLDERNKQNQLMWSGPVQHRSFKNWSMAFIKTSELPELDKPVYSDFLQSGLSETLNNKTSPIAKTILLTMRDDFLRAQ